MTPTRAWSEVVGPVLSQLLDELVWPVQHRHVSRRHDGRTGDNPPAQPAVRRSRHGRSRGTYAGAPHVAEHIWRSVRKASGAEIVQYLKTLNDPEDEPYIADSAIQEVIALCRRQGYAGRFNEPFVPRTSSIAIPILVNGYARSCIAVVWLTSSMSFNRAVRQFVLPIREAAKQSRCDSQIHPNSGRCRCPPNRNQRPAGMA